MLRSLILPAFVLATATSALAQPSSPREAMFVGVNDTVQVADNFSPGAVCFFAENAFPIALGYTEGRQTPRIPMAAASYYGKGRAVILGHSGLVGGDFFKANPSLCYQLIVFLAYETEPPERYLYPAVNEPDVRIAVIGEQATADFLKEQKFAADFFREFTDAAVSEQYDVLIINAERIRENQIEKIDAFVKNGGGLLAAATGWGWQQLNPSGDLKTTFAGNKLVAPMGLVWTNQFAPRPRSGYQPAMGAYSKFLHPKVALDAVLNEQSGTAIPAADWTQIVFTLELALDSIPEREAARFDGLQKLITRQVIPTKQSPVVAAEQPLDRLAMLLQTQRYMNVQARGGLPVGLVVPKFEAAAEFPGGVPEDAERVRRAVSINASIPDWHSTGLYAAPGEVITINTNGFVVHNGAFSVRIGALSDKLWHLPRWERYPEISMSVSLGGIPASGVNGTFQVVNPFGGHVYIVVPRGLSGTVEVQISGAVEAPYYVFGKTTDEEWKQSRQAPAPWAELASDRVILTVPSYLVRELDNPKEVMEFWNGVLDACAELAAWEGRARPERITADRQISAGWMHAGYPVMTPTQTERGLTDLAYLKERGDKWGFFHEFGHNHQSGDWTFSGSGEVTVNLFTLYIFEKMYGIPISETRREMRPDVRKEAKARHIAAGAPFAQWQRDPFLALTMYVELIEEFGWESFIAVFGEYRHLSANQRPRNDDEKRDQWMVRFSKQVGKNLGPFFDQWGVPVSQTAKDSIAELPVWLPE